MVERRRWVGDMATAVERTVMYEVGDRSRGPFKGFTPKLAIFTLLQNTLLIWEKPQKNNPKRGNSLDFKLVGSRVLRANIYRMALIIVSLNVVVPDILYGAHTENIHCNDIKSGRLVIAPDKKILKMIKQPSPKFPRVSHPPVVF